MSHPCPHCGKPTRRGAKFCGFCGQEIVNLQTDLSPRPTSPPVIRQQSPPRSPQSEKPATKTPQASTGNNIFCPNCGQPVRAGVKFCPACGEAVPPLPSQSPPDSSSGKDRSAAKKWALVTVIIIGIILVCCFGGVFAVSEGWSSEPTSTPTVENEEIFRPTPISSPSPMVENTPTVQPEPTQTETPTSTPTPTITPTITKTPALIFRDTFDTHLDQWKIWEAAQQPTITDYGTLELPRNETRNTGLTTTRTDIPLRNTTFEFEMWLAKNSPVPSSVRFTWYPEEQPPQPPEAPGWLTLEVEVKSGIARLLDPKGEELCQMKLGANVPDKFLVILKVGNEYTVQMSVNGMPPPEPCKKSSTLPNLEINTGHVSFSGTGVQIDNLKIYFFGGDA